MSKYRVKVTVEMDIELNADCKRPTERMESLARGAITLCRVVSTETKGRIIPEITGYEFTPKATT